MTLGNDNGTDGQTDRQTDRVRRNMRPPPREEGRIIMMFFEISIPLDLVSRSVSFTFSVLFSLPFISVLFVPFHNNSNYDNDVDNHREG